MNTSPETTSSRASIATLALVSVGFAVFLSAVWTARTDSAFVPDYTLHLARFVKVAGCFAIAYLFRSFIPSIPKLLGVGLACEFVHLICHIALIVLPTGAMEYAPAAVMSGVFAGVGEACITLLFAHLFSTFAPRMSAVAIPAAYLLNEILYCAAVYLPAEALTVARPACKMLGIGILLVCLARKRAVAQSEDTSTASPDELQMQYGLPRGPQSRLLSMLTRNQEWTLLLVSATLFPFIFGLVAHICSSTGLRSGLYDVPNELFAIGLLAMLVIYGTLRGTRFTFDEIMCLAIPLFATGCLVLPVLATTGATTAGTLVKCAYTLYQVLFWMLLARKCYEDPRHVYLYFGVFYGTFELATALARLLGSWLNPTFAGNPLFVPMVAAASLWLMSLYGLFFFMISRKWEQRIATGNATLGNGTRVKGAAINAGPHKENRLKAFDADTMQTERETPDAESSSGQQACKEQARLTHEHANSNAVAPTVNRAEAPAAPAQSAPAQPAEDEFISKLDAFCKTYGFSAREKDVLVETIHGYSMENIGKKLFISRETVKTHLRRMYAKAGVSSKQELVSLIDNFPTGGIA